MDGGGSRTRARILSAASWAGLAEQPIILGMAEGPASGLAGGIDRSWDAIQSAIAAAWRACKAHGSAGAPVPASQCALAVAVAGGGHGPWADAFRAQNPGYGRLAVCSDAVAAVLGAYGTAPGRMVLAGTGSVGIAQSADGQLHRVGGWGFPLGDEGGGAWLGQRALALTHAAMDGRQPWTPLTRSVAAHCGRDRDRLLTWGVKLDACRAATLAPSVMAAAAEGDAQAQALLQEAADHLWRLADALEAAAPGAPLCLGGSVAEALMTTAHPLAIPPSIASRLHRPAGDALDGAVQWLLRETAGGRASCGNLS